MSSFDVVLVKFYTHQTGTHGDAYYRRDETLSVPPGVGMVLPLETEVDGFATIAEVYVFPGKRQSIARLAYRQDMGPPRAIQLGTSTGPDPALDGWEKIPGYFQDLVWQISGRPCSQENPRIPEVREINWATETAYRILRKSCDLEMMLVDLPADVRDPAVRAMGTLQRKVRKMLGSMYHRRDALRAAETLCRISLEDPPSAVALEVGEKLKAFFDKLEQLTQS